MISVEDYASALVEKAMGWLGWDFDTAMNADCCAIILAYDGRLDMLKAVFGSGEEPEPEPLTPAAFRAFGK